MRRPRLSLRGLLAVVLIVAADLAALRATLPVIPNPGLALMVLILEVGLFRVAARRGAARAFWLGFEVVGWSYVLAGFVFNRPAWRLARGLFEGWVLGRPIGQPAEMTRFLLFAGGVHLLLALSAAWAGRSG